jgi:hypothetical protein
VVLFCLWGIHPIYVPLRGEPRYGDIDDHSSLVSLVSLPPRLASEHGEWFPMWLPHFEGGVPYASVPPVISVGIFYPLYVFLDPIYSMKIVNLLNFLIGLLGFYFLAKQTLRFPQDTALLGTLAWGTSGYFVNKMTGGNYCEGSYFLIPAFMALAAKGGWLRIFLSALMLHVMIADVRFGFVQFVATSAVLFLFAFLPEEKRPVFARNLCVSSFLAVLLSSAKVFPLFSFFLQSRFDPGSVHQEWVHPAQFFTHFVGARNSVYSMGFSGTLFLMGVAGIVLSIRKRPALFIFFAASILLVLGKDSPIDLYSVMLKVPYIRMMGTIHSHLAATILFITCLGLLLFLETVRNKKILFIAASILIIGFSIDSAIRNVSFSNTIYRVLNPDSAPFREQPLKDLYYISAHEKFADGTMAIEDYGTRYRRIVKDSVYSRMHWLMRAGIGSMLSYPEAAYGNSAVPKFFVEKTGLVPNPAYFSEAYFVRELSDNRPIQAVTISDRTMNTIELELPENPSTGRIKLNQNFHTGWKANYGSLIEAADGLMILDLGTKDPPKRIRLSFCDIYFLVGFYVSTFTLVSCLLALIWRNFSRSPSSPPDSTLRNTTA